MQKTFKSIILDAFKKPNEETTETGVMSQSAPHSAYDFGAASVVFDSALQCGGSNHLSILVESTRKKHTQHLGHCAQSNSISSFGGQPTGNCVCLSRLKSDVRK